MGGRTSVTKHGEVQIDKSALHAWCAACSNRCYVYVLHNLKQKTVLIKAVYVVGPGVGGPLWMVGPPCKESSWPAVYAQNLSSEGMFSHVTRVQ